MEDNYKEMTLDELIATAERYKRWWMEETTNTADLRKQAEKMRSHIDELEDTINLRAASIEELEIVNETLREKNAKLFGEVCGLKFAIRCREMFNDYIPEEGETA